MTLLPLIDLDILTYELAFLKDPYGNDRNWNYVRKLADKKIRSICDKATGTTDEVEWKGYLTGTGNFRLERATIKPYKGTRSKSKPANYYNLREYFESLSNVTVVDGQEADDQICIDQSYDNREIVFNEEDAGNTVICSRDKDLRICPGWHYSWPTTISKEKPLWFQDTLSGYKLFFKQMMTGDTVDNIPGLYGCGPTKANSTVDPCDNTDSMHQAVKKKYIDYFGSHWEMFYRENAELLWMRQHNEVPIQEQIDQWQNGITNQPTDQD